METIVVTATEARRNFFELINAAKFGGQTALITTNGKIAAKIVPAQSTTFDWKKYFKDLPKIRGILTSSDFKSMKNLRKNIDNYFK